MKINLSIQFIYQKKEKKKEKKEKENCMELLSIGNEYISHNLYTKDLDRFMCNKAKHCCLISLQCFSRKEILINHRDVCLELNEKQATKMLEEGSKVQFSN